ncbi:hypothetical protein COCSADRAFT_219647 [Bipolaris sorokiniana ND90Pr]|uniref:Uncharacterized protein n=1 Tax=Cochliobolus sativus (strain ND90Pr / ATCC 201652) TaxID=665912 RepID=M2S587_COCSN|nr:uncharacterized protein COCSADRAFT_219647 [Bipolaris sorokiniana ND90Pr]EMD62328.1 hypothetical protein COCSADRAFT_219647 [Bipolaris sorokiniana ND90Pr]
MASTAGGTAQSFQTRPAVGNPARRVVCKCAMENGWAVVGVWCTRGWACVSDPGWATICPSIRVRASWVCSWVAAPRVAQAGEQANRRPGPMSPAARRQLGERNPVWRRTRLWIGAFARRRSVLVDASQCVGRYRAPAPRLGAGERTRTSARAGGGLYMSLTRGSRVLGERGSWMR